MRATDEMIEGWLQRNGYRDNFFIQYGRWIGVIQKQPNINPQTGEAESRFAYCHDPAVAQYSGVLQGDLGCSTSFKKSVNSRLWDGLKATGILMFWVMATMVPVALIVGVLAGMREGSRLDRTLSVSSIASTATPLPTTSSSPDSIKAPSIWSPSPASRTST